MMGELTRQQIEQLLRSEVTGRIGCRVEGRTYVVPISYTYDGENVYAHSADGMKVHAMRADPNVCFEVEHIDNLANWRCVIAWGRFQELKGDEEQLAQRQLAERFAPLVTSESSQPGSSPRTEQDRFDDAARRSIFYRIHLFEKTGRFEKR